MLYLLVFTQFRTQNRYALLLELLGGVDGFDQDEHTGQGDESGEVGSGLLTAHRHPFEPLQLADELLNSGTQLI